MVDTDSRRFVTGLGPDFRKSIIEVNFEKPSLIISGDTDLQLKDVLPADTFAIMMIGLRREAAVVRIQKLFALHPLIFFHLILTNGAHAVHVIYLYMKTVLNKLIDSRFTLRIVQSDTGYHFEVLDNGKLGFGTYFLYGEKLHKAALCVGGALYGLYHDDKLAEDVMSIIHNHEKLLGGDELTRYL